MKKLVKIRKLQANILKHVWSKMPQRQEVDSRYKTTTTLAPYISRSIVGCLLGRCLGFIQNANKSFNVITWRMVPKHLHCDAMTIEIVAYIAVTNGTILSSK